MCTLYMKQDLPILEGFCGWNHYDDDDDFDGGYDDDFDGGHDDDDDDDDFDGGHDDDDDDDNLAGSIHAPAPKLSEHPSTLNFSSL